jgi:hypothetical protein
MGMFNSIVSDLLCPDKKAVSKNSEIQRNSGILI